MKDLQRIHQIDVRLEKIDRIFHANDKSQGEVEIEKYKLLRDEALKIISEKAIILNSYDKQHE